MFFHFYYHFNSISDCFSKFFPPRYWKYKIVPGGYNVICYIFYEKKLLLKYKHGNDIHEQAKQQNE